MHPYMSLIIRVHKNQAQRPLPLTPCPQIPTAPKGSQELLILQNWYDVPLTHALTRDGLITLLQLGQLYDSDDRKDTLPRKAWYSHDIRFKISSECPEFGQSGCYARFHDPRVFSSIYPALLLRC